MGLKLLFSAPSPLPSCEGTARDTAVQNRGESLTKNPTVLSPLSWLCRPQKCRKQISVVYKAIQSIIYSAYSSLNLAKTLCCWRNWVICSLKCSTLCIWLITFFWYQLTCSSLYFIHWYLDQDQRIDLFQVYFLGKILCRWLYVHLIASVRKYILSVSILGMKFIFQQVCLAYSLNLHLIGFLEFIDDLF